MRAPTRMIVFVVIIFTSLVLLLALREVDFLVLSRDAKRLAIWIRGQGAGAPLVIIALQVAQVLLAPIPGQIVGVASGYLFGALWGTLYSLVGTALGSLIAFSLARAYGRPLVERVVSARTLAQLDAGARRRGLFFLVLVFLLPFLPDDLACFVAGLSPIPVPALLVAAVAARAPGVLVASWLGASAGELSMAQWAAVLVVSILLAGLFLIYGEEFQKMMIQRITRDEDH